MLRYEGLAHSTIASTYCTVSHSDYFVHCVTDTREVETLTELEKKALKGPENFL